MVRVREGTAPLLPTSREGQARGNAHVRKLAAGIAGLAAVSCVFALVMESGAPINGPTEDLGIPISLSPGNKVLRKMQILRDTSRLTSKDRFDVHYDSKTGVVTMTDKQSGVTTVVDKEGEVEHRRFIKYLPHLLAVHAPVLTKRVILPEEWEYNYDPKTGDLTMKNLRTGATTLSNADKGILQPLNDFPSMDFFPGVDGNMSSIGLNGEIMDGAGQLETARAPHNRYLGMGKENEYEAAYRIYSLYPNASHPPMEGWDKEGITGWGNMPQAKKQ